MLIFIYFGILISTMFFVVNIFLKKLRPKIDKKQILENYLIKAKNTRKIKNNKKQIFQKFLYHFILCLEIIFSCIVFFVILYNYNFGQVRLFCFVGYILGMVTAYQIIKHIIKIVVQKRLKRMLNKN